jgi:DNA-directed RNA polymerase specialized sigma24 family protein
VDDAFWPAIYSAAARTAARWAVDRDERSDIVQEAVVRLYVDSLDSDRPMHALATAWVCGIVDNVARERLRGRKRESNALAGRIVEGRGKHVGSADTQGREIAELREWIRAAITRLPLPHARIAELRLCGAPNRGIASFLQTWRGVGIAETRRLLKETHELLRLALDGEEPCRRFPKKFSSRNPWNAIPPPPPWVT